ncbi:hypothetical protein ACFX2C_005995 [Malus domestica]
MFVSYKSINNIPTSFAVPDVAPISPNDTFFPVSSPPSSASSVTDDAVAVDYCIATASRTDNDPSSFSVAVNHHLGESFATSSVANRMEL